MGEQACQSELRIPPGFPADFSGADTGSVSNRSRNFSSAAPGRKRHIWSLSQRLTVPGARPPPSSGAAGCSGKEGVPWGCPRPGPATSLSVMSPRPGLAERGWAGGGAVPAPRGTRKGAGDTAAPGERCAFLCSSGLRLPHVPPPQRQSWLREARRWWQSRAARVSSAAVLWWHPAVSAS